MACAVEVHKPSRCCLPQLGADVKRAAIDAMCDVVTAHLEELTALDRAIGDADHGENLVRGFEAVRAQRDPLSAMPSEQCLQAIGQILVLNVGGASGPLFGTFFIALGKCLGSAEAEPDLAKAFSAALQAVKARGHAEPGQKTIVDVLCVVEKRLSAGDIILSEVHSIAEEAALQTVDMRALRGRASYLGARSIGHMDPGARSASLLLSAVCAVLEGAVRQ